MNKVWFITGAARRLGAAIAKAALTDGDRVVVSGRRTDALENVFAEYGERVLAVALDVTDEAQALAAAEKAVARFGRIDVLVNNAGYGQLGPFEDNFVSDADKQFATNVFGVFNVCRAVLPIMRQQRSGHIFNLSSMGGLVGMGGAALYCASKFAVEGFSESLALEVGPFGIKVTLVEPGVFRTDFLDASSAVFGARGLEDYATFTAKVKSASAAYNHRQTGSPTKLGGALVQLANSAQPPLRYLAGSDAYQQVRDKLDKMLAQIEQWRPLTCSTDGE
ncbi:SDR family NAD(P)-dependent oxidoreductase [Pseudomonas gessardii]|uniref:SDR family NAD(P)-dependent oxidoreductase n=1 Tax=Pseudomonas gessardii TaxID=78544 RepID=A0ABS9FB61_9PSED|nr:oxidoreductase [Pseudomonas gessardii]MCF4980111.1 SDR family NAD(P)-dependent oxidoreductase [Pseudomonas gessardii]MCF4991423.1 SDR family NAD(P)-dependent oxidoreductase [Pseudomonas gessardii]MCF5085098.1 SDR family NAD(P)-dependent oxidoreductase [Pseudomonas gessardii]MCF5093355.1 SDR family NAD(P)-dependent oxidoreductase [Pseudomonas gessardii]MCF5109590.1 SDR family NAD(P)-dependent oxidoreductase [Pseudomonas gessardii]